MCIHCVLYLHWVWYLVKLKELFHKPKTINQVPDEELPDVTLLVAAYNEEEVVRAKMNNSQALDYPADKLSSLLNSNSDGASSDLPNYQVTPRVSAASMIPEVHDTIPQPSTLPDNMLPADEDEDAIEDLDGEEPQF